MIEDRADLIDKGVEYAQSAKSQLDNARLEAQKYIDEARRQQAEMLRDADRMKTQIIEEARQAATVEAQKVMDAAKVSIQQERREAELRIRDEVSRFSLEIAEKVVRQQMAENGAQKKTRQFSARRNRETKLSNANNGPRPYSTTLCQGTACVCSRKGHGQTCL